MRDRLRDGRERSDLERECERGRVRERVRDRDRVRDLERVLVRERERERDRDKRGCGERGLGLRSGEILRLRLRLCDILRLFGIVFEANGFRGFLETEPFLSCPF